MDYLVSLNKLLRGNADISEVFKADGFVRLNMIYINPYSLIELKNYLSFYGLKDLSFKKDGLSFVFENNGVGNMLEIFHNNISRENEYEIRFSGNFTITQGVIKNSKEESGECLGIYSVELDFDSPKHSSSQDLLMLNIISTFLSYSDSLFFMTYKFDIDKEILENPLDESVDLLTIEFKNLSNISN
ncbi:hypothetical protein NUSPORA_01659 [Nucleospora cyclopteri]